MAVDYLRGTAAVRNSSRPLRILRSTATILLTSALGLADATADTHQSGRAVQSDVLSGQQLLDRHCTSCHLAPRPADLPKEDWPTALHWMGHYVGLRGEQFPDRPVTVLESYAPYVHVYALTDATGLQRRLFVFRPFIRDEPAMSSAEYQRLGEYLISNAPTRREMTIERDRHPVLGQFTPFYPHTGIAPNSFIPSLLVDETQHRLYVGRGSNPPARRVLAPGEAPSGTSDEVHVFDLKNGRAVSRLQLMTVPLSLEATASGLRIGTHGVFPVDMNHGWGQVLDWEGLDTGAARLRMLLNGYHRITHHQTADLDSDGRPDLVVSCMGDGIQQVGGGRLSIHWATPQYAALYQQAPALIPAGPLPGALDETVLLERAGMIDFEIADFDRDGKLDLVLLTAQAQHQVILFINQGNRRFTSRVIMERGPSFGSISVDVADFDRDGLPDLLVTNGNNVELVVQRPYHGVRIYQNNGDQTFAERFFYPMHGATRAVVRDFDGDGHLDVAAIALFPNWARAEPETFVYLAGRGPWQFEPRALDSAHWAPWSSIAAGDINGDGRTDIVLGLGDYFFSVPPDWTTRAVMQGRDPAAVPSVLFLLNQ